MRVFTCTRVDRGGTANLFARWGAKGAARSFGFNGHTDVVPIGVRSDWTRDPFGGEMAEGRVWGRGACDMKSGVASFVAAAIDFVRDTPPDGAVILAITGDEEGPAQDGTSRCWTGCAPRARRCRPVWSANPHAPTAWAR